LELTFSANIFEGFLLFFVGLLVAGPPSFELHLTAPQKPSDTLRMSVVHSSGQKEAVSLDDGSYLAPLHGLLELFEGFSRDDLVGATLVYPTHQKLLQTLLAVGDEPPLALAPTIAQSLGCFS
jgi:hypothetical protein